MVLVLLTGTELSLGPLDLTILPSTSMPSELIFPAALMVFSLTCLQSIIILAVVLLITTCN